MKMLPGIVFKRLRRLPDERGFFTEILRTDWKDLLNGDEILQANMSLTYPEIVRAWHRHRRGQVDYFLVIRGSAKIGAYDEESGELDEIISTGEDIQVVRMPGHYWHGFKAVGIEPVTMIYFTTRLYDYGGPDEERRPWDDPKIVPRSINGKTDDPRCKNAWDWFHPPHK